MFFVDSERRIFEIDLDLYRESRAIYEKRLQLFSASQKVRKLLFEARDLIDKIEEKSATETDRQRLKECQKQLEALGYPTKHMVN